MGSTNKPAIKDYSRQDQSFIINSKHPKFIDAKYLLDKDYQSYYQVIISIENIQIFNSWMKKITQIKHKLQNHSLLLPNYYKYQQKGLCGSAGIIRCKFQAYPYLLVEQIHNRKMQNLTFQDQQIWFLLYKLVQSASSLHRLNMTVGDIRPHNIFINDNGQLTLISKFSFPQEYTNYEKLIYDNQTTYLPPQAVYDLQIGNQLPTYDQIIGQSFSIGLTILNTIILKDYTFIKSNAFSFQFISYNESIKILQQSKIDQNIKKIIISLYKINPKQRITCLELYQFLKQYQKQIINLQQFQICQLPELIQNGLNNKNIKKISLGTKTVSRKEILFTDRLQNSQFNSQTMENIAEVISIPKNNQFPTICRSTRLQKILQSSYLMQESQVHRVLTPNISQSFLLTNRNNQDITNIEYKPSQKVQRILLKDKSVHHIMEIDQLQDMDFPQQPEQNKIIQTLQSKEYKSEQQSRKKAFQYMQSYRNILKNIDQQLQQSIRLFPDSYK